MMPSVTDRLIHRDMIPGRAGAVKAHRAPIERFLRIERRRAVDLAAETEFRVLIGAHDPRLRFT
jgi:hypothetical protein